MAANRRLLVADDDDSLREALVMMLEHAGYRVAAAATGDEAVEAVRREPVELTLLDLRLGSESGLDLLPRLKKIRPEMSVIMITALGTIESAVEAMKLGADNYLTKPVDPPSLLALVAKGLESRRLRRRTGQLERLARGGPDAPLGNSPAMLRALELAAQVAGRETTVLLQGETGSGKGILARRIHDLSSRSDAPFVELNCAGFQRDLVESELFGHEKGSFSGAVDRKIGLFEAADGGTLFLDEIGEMDLSVQAKLLKVIESRRFRRLGGLAEIEVDVRLLAATHRDLAADAASGRFREDLFYRLAVFEIPIPPLRERGDDVLELAGAFLAGFRGAVTPQLSSAARLLLVGYDWPGNVRELRNVMERAAILAPAGAPVEPGHLPPLRRGSRRGTEPAPAAAPPLRSMREAEQEHLEQALAAHDGNVQATARALGISRGTLYRKARKYGIPLVGGAAADDDDADD